MNEFAMIGQQSLYCIIPLLVVSLAGLYSEKGGIMNIALEGLMMAGAFTGILFIHQIQKYTGLDNQWILVLALIIADLLVPLFLAFTLLPLSHGMPTR
jgi:simple sugar transport system permease protein